MMLHDSACSHTATATQDLVVTFGSEQFDHPPYSPDLAPRDFHVFLQLKTSLGGRWFHDDKVKEAINTWFAWQAASFYDAGIQKLVPQQWWELCRKIVCSIYIKWQYKWFGNKLLFFFFSSPSELSIWITYILSYITPLLQVPLIILLF
jgi:hypothetical protein